MTNTYLEASMHNPKTSLPVQTTEVHSEYTDIPTAPTANTIQKVDQAMARLMSTMMANMKDMRLRMEGNERQESMNMDTTMDAVVEEHTLVVDVDADVVSNT